MSKQGENLALVHLQIDALHSLEAIRINLFDITDLQVLIVELLRRNFGSDALVVSPIQVLQLKWIRQSLPSLLNLITTAGF